MMRPAAATLPCPRSRCTFLNTPDELECVMCGTDWRPGGYREPTPPPPLLAVYEDIDGGARADTDSGGDTDTGTDSTDGYDTE